MKITWSGLVPVAALFALTIPLCLTVGLFVDGLTYASIARNLAHGDGSFWNLSYTRTLYPQFYEHPPLGLWIESLVFVLFGEKFFVERLFGVALATLVLLQMACLWRLSESGQQRHAWIPGTIFALFGVTQFVATDNLLEGIAAVFTGAGTICYLLASAEKRVWPCCAWAMIAAGAVIAGMLVKGPLAIFPVLVPLCHVLFLGGRTRNLLVAALATLTVGAAAAAILYADESSRHYLSRYLENQVLASVAGRRELAPDRSAFVRYFVGDTIAAIAVVGVVCALARTISFGKTSKFYLAIFVCSALPILASPKQNRWYIYLSLPMFALFLATVCAGSADRIAEFVSRWRGAKYLPGALVVVLLVFTAVAAGVRLGTVSEHQDFYRDIPIGGLEQLRDQTLEACPAELGRDWYLVAALQRYHRASVGTDAAALRITSNSGDCPVAPGCVQLNPAAAVKYRLYRCPLP